MTEDDITTIDRRTALKAIGSTAATIGVAGCLSSKSEDPQTTTSTESPSTTTQPTTETQTYEVCMEPAGCKQFDAVPETWVTWHAGYADIGVALGELDGLLGMNRPGRHATSANELFYSELPDVSIDTSDILDLRGGGDSVDKEVFYEMDADIHLIDPVFAQHHFDWNESDVTELEQNISAFFGSHARRDRGYNSEYLMTLYEVFEKIAKVFQAEEKYGEFERIHSDLVETIDSATPKETPNAALLWDGKSSAFRAGDPTAVGYENKQYRDLEVPNAFEGFDVGYRGDIDYELLLEVDPDTIFYHNNLRDFTREEFEEERIAPMEKHSVGRQLSAVQNDRVYRGGFVDQGPIMNLFQIEILAKQLYPDTFTGSEELFDRKAVADAVKGNF
ncbi:ABC-type Fe3+-hydroxamate transport system, periplasmic component [Halanaeroarchaeum sp. HSR-CO]|uniref:ABC transporter substrate-binding protein n=1 Tax=Halanaeroarchaeum sp. HSR-CO TaxID=2866382 RepID=UPI00217CECC9|nr:ABC transporter substrate-binding protein [Halanaeroarchaeum sp. HSR-CO]UWG48509.1 ABC-type Fe3+-hydroxamate transport system, periplasmic component [Halanaeroarchaeum sp. HSR-CO]